MNRIARGRHTPLTPPSPPAEGGVGRGKGDIDPDFARLMAPLGPFEARPQLAVAVSGGADSLALALLAERWARARGGRIVALTVDHGLRRESAGEAAAVARWMKRRGIAHRILVWRGAKPGAGIQAAARAARYRLLEDWCAARARARGIVHLLLGHQREDQAETLLLRLERGSAAYGLAAMPAITERPGVRLLRPLLAVPRAALADFLRREGQAWIDDPSNRDRRYRRVHMRAALGGDSALSKRIADSAAELGRTRAALEAGVADCLVRAVTLHPEAYASLDGAALAAAGREIGERALGALLATIGGADYAPRRASLQPLYRDLTRGRIGAGRTLAGCRIMPLSGRRDRFIVCREQRGFAAAALRGAMPILWDGRYVSAGGARRGLFLAALGAKGWAEIAARAPWLRRGALPASARLALPALFDRKGVHSVPALGYRRARPGAPAKPGSDKIVHRPQRALAPPYYAASTPLTLPESTIV